MRASPNLLSAVLIALCASTAHATEVAVCTDRGRFVIELADTESPKHVENFLRYVDMGYYSGTVFHRVVPRYVVQGGGVDRTLRSRPTLPPVENESSNGLSNFRSTVAAARGQDPDSATSQFFVNLEDNTQLDASREPGYTVFGRVKEGILVLEEIGGLPTGAADPFSRDVPTPVPVIFSIARLDAAALDALPPEDRDAVIKERIAAAAAAEDHETALVWIEHYRAICADADPQIALLEARAAVARDLRPRAVFVLQEYFALTPPSDATYAEALELYRAVVPEDEPDPQLAKQCGLPQAPQIEDGARASEDEMFATQASVRTFVAAGEKYLACLAKIIDNRRSKPEERDAATAEHNRMVNQMERAAADFNEQVRLFRARGD
jgi:peptidyl-prolyl cis-trans isomerase A (cyclophilin A)